MIDYSKYHNLEKYIFNNLSRKFHKKGYLNSFEFFCIIIWKSNRSKSYIYKNLKKNDKRDIDKICKDLTSKLKKSSKNEEKIKLLLDKGFKLPIASAILTVLYPKTFTIYDKRVCENSRLKRYLKIKNKKLLVKDYFKFLEDVKKMVPCKKNLRDKDKFLWGKSFYKNLKNDLEKGFKKPN